MINLVIDCTIATETIYIWRFQSERGNVGSSLALLYKYQLLPWIIHHSCLISSQVQCTQSSQPTSNLRCCPSLRHCSGADRRHGLHRCRRRPPAARRVRAVPGAGPRDADAEAGQDPPQPGLPHHLRQLGVQPPAPAPLPRRRRARRPPGLPLRRHPGGPAAVRRRRHPGRPVALPRHHGELPPALQAPPRRPQLLLPGRRPAGHLRRRRRRHELHPGSRQRDRRALRALLDRQHLRLLGLPLLPRPHGEGHLPPQRCRAADERVLGHAGELGRGDGQEHPAQGLPKLHAVDGPGRVHGPLRAEGDGADRRRRRRDPQHLRRAGAGGAGRHARHGAAVGVNPHHRPARLPRRGDRAPGRPRRRAGLQPLEGGRHLLRLAGRQGGQVGGVRELRQHHGDEQRGAGGVRVGASQQRPRLPVGHPPRPRQRRRRRAAAGVPRRRQGPRPPGELVPAGGGAAARGGGRVPHALRLELHAGEPLRRRAHAVLALLRGAADQLPVQVRGVGRGHGGRPRRAARGRGGEDPGGHGGGEGKGDAVPRGGVEGDRSPRDAARWALVRQPRQAGRRRAPLGWWRRRQEFLIDNLSRVSSLPSAALPLTTHRHRPVCFVIRHLYFVVRESRGNSVNRREEVTFRSKYWKASWLILYPFAVFVASCNYGCK